MARKRCALCGAYLDPGEWCDCEDDPAPVDELEARRPLKGRQMSMDDLYARYMGIDKEDYLR